MNAYQISIVWCIVGVFTLLAFWYGPARKVRAKEKRLDTLIELAQTEQRRAQANNNESKEILVQARDLFERCVISSIDRDGLALAQLKIDWARKVNAYYAGRPGAEHPGACPTSEEESKE